MIRVYANRQRTNLRAFEYLVDLLMRQLKVLASRNAEFD